MQKTYLAKVLMGTTLLLLAPQLAFASNMGNGPAGLLVWLIGMLIALVISGIFSCSRNELGAFNKFHIKRFIVGLVIQIPIVFIIGVVAMFI